MEKNNFHTFRDYMQRLDTPLTASMEDYLEMIYRLSAEQGFTRMHELSSALHVQPPAATKMVQRLSELHLIDYQKYGILVLQPAGRKMGSALLERHNLIENFLRALGIGETEVLQETEKMEHTISDKTLNRISRFLAYLAENPETAEAIRGF